MRWSDGPTARAIALFSLAVSISAVCDGHGSVEAGQVFADTTAAVLAQAAAEGDTARIRQLIRAGADPDAQGDRGVTLLQWALLHRSATGLEALLEGGANPSRADSSGETVVHYAAKANDPRYLDILLAHHADPNTPNTVTGTTPLMSALMGNREVQFRRLLAAGASARLVDRFGNTALHLAAKINAHERVLDLLQAGADPLARNRQGATFQHYLSMTPPDILSGDARRQREMIAAWLREHGVRVEQAPSRRAGGAV